MIVCKLIIDSIDIEITNTAHITIATITDTRLDIANKVRQLRLLPEVFFHHVPTQRDTREETPTVIFQLRVTIIAESKAKQILLFVIIIEASEERLDTITRLLRLWIAILISTSIECRDIICRRILCRSIHPEVVIIIILRT